MELQIAGGSVRGKDHIIAGKNNQDAFVIRKTPSLTAAIVCDGCGSGAHSEVGAKIAAEALTNLLTAELFNDVSFDGFDELLESTRNDLEDYLKDVFFREYDERAFEIVNSYGLFTMLGFFQNKNLSAFFGLGDGYFIINDMMIKVGPFPNNAPPYLGYNLLNRKENFNIVEKLYNNELNSFLIATDGLEELVEAEEIPHPTIKDRNVGNISQFWKEDKYFTNPFTLGRQLNLLAGGVPRIIDVNGEKFFATRNGIFRDDTTMVVGRTVNDVS